MQIKQCWFWFFFCVASCVAHFVNIRLNEILRGRQGNFIKLNNVETRKCVFLMAITIFLALCVCVCVILRFNRHYFSFSVCLMAVVLTADIYAQAPFYEEYVCTTPCIDRSMHHVHNIHI